jgi:hypothetical protein
MSVVADLVLKTILYTHSMLSVTIAMASVCEQRKIMDYKCLVNSYDETSVYKRDSGKFVPKPVTRPRQTGAMEALPGPPSLKSNRLSTNWVCPLFLRAPVVCVVGLDHPKLSPLWLHRPMSVLGLQYSINLQTSLDCWESPLKRSTKNRGIT